MQPFPVRLPPNEMKALGDFLNDYAEDYKDAEIGEWASKVYESLRFPLDSDALRLVLDVAKLYQEAHDFDKLRKDAPALEHWNNTHDAIAKVESLIR
jgi:hypothetical protein